MTDEVKAELREEGAAPDLLGDVLIRQPQAQDDLASRPLFPPTEEDEPTPAAPPEVFAPVSPRAKAFVVDGLLCALLAGGSLIAAGSAAMRSPTLASGLWSALFALLLSFFLAIPTLALFGKTPGMALADLTAESTGAEKPTLSEAARRWLGTVLTVLLGGIPAVTVLFDRQRRTPADLLSGRPLRLLIPEPAR